MSDSDEATYTDEPTGDEAKIPEYDGETLYERLGGVYGIAGAVDILTDRLFENDTANQNPVTQEFHETHDKAGFTYLVTAWSVTYSGGPDVYRRSRPSASGLDPEGESRKKSSRLYGSFSYF